MSPKGMLKGDIRVAIVTGVSTGIGYAITRQLVNAGWEVFGTVRKAPDAERLHAVFGARFHPLILDITDRTAIVRAERVVRTHLQGRMLDVLVNNAGIVVPGPLVLQPIEHIQAQLQTNLVAPLRLIQIFAPLLGMDKDLSGKPGRIVNISSIAGKVAVPMMGGYAASKHGLEAISDALRRELAIFGIKLITVNPGSIKSAIFDRTHDDLKHYEGTVYERPARIFARVMEMAQSRSYSAELFAKKIFAVLVSPRPKARVKIIPRIMQNWYLPQLLPPRITDAGMQKSFGLIPDTPISND